MIPVTVDDGETVEAIKQKVDALQETVTLMLEDKIARETEKRVQEEERNQLLTDALAQEKKRGFLSRLFSSGSE